MLELHETVHFVSGGVICGCGGAGILMPGLTGLNSLLNKGFLAVAWIMSTPLLITLHSIIALVFLLFLHKNLF